MKVYEVLFCKYCYDPTSDFNEEIQTLSAGDESWDICPSCRGVEQDTITVYVDENNMPCSSCTNDEVCSSHER